MSPSARFFLFQLMIVLPFLAGMALRGRIASARDLTRRIIRFNLVLIEPLLALWSIWGLQLTWGMAVLPLSGLLLVIGGMGLGRLMLPAMGLQGRSRATFLISSSIANHGFTMGTFLCFLFLGETGLGLSFLFISYFMIYIFTVIFSYARHVSRLGEGGIGIAAQVLDIQNLPLLAVAAALVLHALDFPRPEVYFPLDALMMISVGLYYLSLGMSFAPSKVFCFLRENLALAFIKFAAVPGITIGILSIASLDEQVSAVITLQSFMPAAIYSVVASVLFTLDEEMASNLFVVNTLLFLVIILPLLFVFKGPILGI
ncbi:MAG: AEC family transporter [Desulfomonilia bacterium]|jgi:predicted permease